MARICKDPGCNRPVFGGGYCRAHQWKRTDKKPKTIAKRVAKQSVKADDFGFSTQIELFKKVYWDHEKPVICPVSGRNITKCIEAPINLFVQHCAHILPKGKYTYWRLNPRNIRLLHPEAHWVIDQGTQEDKDARPDWNWEAWYKEVEVAKKEYEQYVKENNL